MRKHLKFIKFPFKKNKMKYKLKKIPNKKVNNYHNNKIRYKIKIKKKLLIN